MLIVNTTFVAQSAWAPMMAQWLTETYVPLLRQNPAFGQPVTLCRILDQPQGEDVEAYACQAPYLGADGPQGAHAAADAMPAPPAQGAAAMRFTTVLETVDVH